MIVGQPKKRGRPSKYKYAPVTIKEPEFNLSHAQALLELLSRGVLNTGCMAELGLKKDTFYRWIREHEDFKDAYEIGRPRCETYWSNQLQQMTLERDDKGAKACIMILNNNFGWGKDDLARGNVTQNNINIHGNMNVIDQKSQTELLEMFKGNLAYLEVNNLLPETIDVEAQDFIDGQSD